MPRFVQSLMLPARGFKYGKGVKLEDQIAAVDKVFAFAYAWALGGNLVIKPRQLFIFFYLVSLLWIKDRSL